MATVTVQTTTPEVESVTLVLSLTEAHAVWRMVGASPQGGPLQVLYDELCDKFEQAGIKYSLRP